MERPDIHTTLPESTFATPLSPLPTDSATKALPRIKSGGDTDSDTSSDWQDQVAAANADDSIILVGKQGYYQAAHKPHRHVLAAVTQAIGKVFGFGKSENLEAVEIVLDPQARLRGPAQENRADYSQIRPTVIAPLAAAAAGSTTQMASGNQDWQKIVNAHVRHDASGHAVDDAGKRIDIAHMNAAFGEKLADICENLDSHGYSGKYEIISGVRSKEEQQRLYDMYKRAGSDHPVALPGNSLHELGCAVDVKCTSGDQVSFFRDYHGAALQSGLALVAGDKEHVQLPRSQVHNFIMQQDNGVQMASAPRPRSASSLAS